MRVKVAHDQLSLGTFNKETSVAIGNQVFLAKKVFDARNYLYLPASKDCFKQLTAGTAPEQTVSTASKVARNHFIF
jgi:hypothetical protein